ncbi:MAG: hypothetical protein OHK0017_05600 [Patescibacteria group bacterium]
MNFTNKTWEVAKVDLQVDSPISRPQALEEVMAFSPKDLAEILVDHYTKNNSDIPLESVFYLNPNSNQEAVTAIIVAVRSKIETVNAYFNQLYGNPDLKNRLIVTIETRDNRTRFCVNSIAATSGNLKRHQVTESRQIKPKLELSHISSKLKNYSGPLDTIGLIAALNTTSTTLRQLLQQPSELLNAAGVFKVNIPFRKGYWYTDDLDKVQWILNLAQELEQSVLSELKLICNSEDLRISKAEAEAWFSRVRQNQNGINSLLQKYNAVVGEKYSTTLNSLYGNAISKIKAGE